MDKVGLTVKKGTATGIIIWHGGHGSPTALVYWGKFSVSCEYLKDLKITE